MLSQYKTKQHPTQKETNHDVLAAELAKRRGNVNPESAQSSPERDAKHHSTNATSDIVSPASLLASNTDSPTVENSENSSPKQVQAYQKLAFKAEDLTVAGSKLRSNKKKKASGEEAGSSTGKKNRNHHNKHKHDAKKSPPNGDLMNEMMAKQGALKKVHKDQKPAARADLHNPHEDLINSPMLQQPNVVHQATITDSNQSTPSKWGTDKQDNVSNVSTNGNHRSVESPFVPISNGNNKSSNLKHEDTDNIRAGSAVPLGSDAEVTHYDSNQLEEGNSLGNGQPDSPFDKFLEHVQTLLDAVKTFYDYAVGVCTKMYEEATSYVNKHWPEFRDTVSPFISPLSSFGLPQSSQYRDINDGGNASQQTSKHNSNRDKRSCCG